MEERKKQILHALIKDYVATAEPVGSRTLAKKYDLGVSPATIRNEMSDLEEQGYIKQPHTSAGRVPSDKGYRYYVDCLMPNEKVPVEQQDEAVIRRVLNSSLHEVDALMKQSAQLLSRMTNYTTMIVRSSVKGGRLAQINLVKMGVNQVLMIMINDAGMIYHRVLEVPESFSDQQLLQFQQFLNSKLCGFSMEQITSTLIQELSMQMLWHQSMLKQALELFEQVVAPTEYEEGIVVNGMLNMLNQPEFRDMDKMRNVLEVLEADNGIKNLMGVSGQEGTTIYIGDELTCPSINYCSIISTPYHINGKIAGTIGVLGPTRMDYARIVSLVEAISRNMSECMTK